MSSNLFLITAWSFHILPTRKVHPSLIWLNSTLDIYFYCSLVDSHQLGWSYEFKLTDRESKDLSFKYLSLYVHENMKNFIQYIRKVRVIVSSYLATNRHWTVGKNGLSLTKCVGCCSPAVSLCVTIRKLMLCNEMYLPAVATPPQGWLISCLTDNCLL